MHKGRNKGNVSTNKILDIASIFVKWERMAPLSAGGQNTIWVAAKLVIIIKVGITTF